jgi:large subunit ribosomal protein L25
MSDQIKIKADSRTVIGKQVKQLRRDGIVPAVIYGANDPISIQMEEILLRRALRAAGTTHVIYVELENRTHTVLVRDIQRHLTRGDLIHIDFLEVDMDVTVSAMADLILINRELSKPVADGLGILVQDLRSVEIEAKPDTLVESITVDASMIKTSHDVIHVSDLVAPKGVIIVADPELVIARFEVFRAEEAGTAVGTDVVAEVATESEE